MISDLRRPLASQKPSREASASLAKKCEWTVGVKPTNAASARVIAAGYRVSGFVL